MTPQVASWASDEQSSLVGAGLRAPRGLNGTKVKARPFLCRTAGPVTVPNNRPVAGHGLTRTSRLVKKELGRLRRGAGGVRSPTRTHRFPFGDWNCTRPPVNLPQSGIGRKVWWPG